MLLCYSMCPPGDYDLQRTLNITTVAAGIVFDYPHPSADAEQCSGDPSPQPSTSEQLKRASVRIRMNSTFVHDTTQYKKRQVTVLH